MSTVVQNKTARNESSGLVKQSTLNEMNIVLKKKKKGKKKKGREKKKKTEREREKKKGGGGGGEKKKKRRNTKPTVIAAYTYISLLQQHKGWYSGADM